LAVILVATSLIGLGLAAATDGRVRVQQTIGTRIHCTVGQTPPAQFKLPADARIDHVARCTRDIFRLPHDWFLIVPMKAQVSGDAKSARVMTVPLDPEGHIAHPFYVDPFVILGCGVYVFLLEWRFGRTLGKRLFGVRIRPLIGVPIDLRRAAKRAMMRLAAFLPSIVFALSSAGWPEFAPWLSQHPAWELVFGIAAALWLFAFAVNYIVATSRRRLPWHDRWAGTEAVLERDDRKLPDVVVMPGNSPLPSWLARQRDPLQQRN
jgi:uncharacterized RDD family membrane protein YckC